MSPSSAAKLDKHEPFLMRSTLSGVVWQHQNAAERAFCVLGTVRQLTQQRTMSRWPTMKGMAFYSQARRRGLVAGTTKTSRTTDYQRLAHDTGAGQIECNRYANTSPPVCGVVGEGITGRDSRACVLSKRKV
jgi:hypothetical protein